ncbi:MAG TPA: sulfite exporter TauE/SafE family protein, partial [Elusimicrobiales bacterium]|nr:sulfite exporter TauE/SafE family protein [Elusimicrobiales bacterium]
VLGLSTGSYCLVSCLPALLPYLLSEGGGSWKADLSILAEFLLGRAAAYFLFAVSAALIGRACNPHLPAWTAPLAMLITALAMLAFLFSGRFGGAEGKCPGKAGARFAGLPLALGFMTGINVCPPFAAAFVRLVQMGDPAAGLVYFSGFFSATSLFLLPALVPGPFMNARLRNIGRMTLFLSAIWYLVLGLKGLSSCRGAAMCGF